MLEWIEKLKELNLNFLYDDFIKLIKEIDEYIVEKGGNFPESFLINLFSIMEMVNDNIKNNNQHITLGQYLIGEKLKKQERITPILLMYWYLKQKNNIGLDNWANEITFCSLSAGGKMATLTDNNNGCEKLAINWSAIEKIKDNGEFNYNSLEYIVHELTHMWLDTRKEDSDDLFERLAYYYNQMSLIVIGNFFGGTNAGNPLMHDCLLNEFMAYEQSKVYMIHFAINNPDCFKSDIIEKKQTLYSKGKILQNPPRENFAFLLNFIKNIYERNSQDEYFAEHYSKILALQDKVAPIIEELETKKISELPGDHYWNIFFKDFYFLKTGKLITQTEQRRLSD